MTNAMRYRRAQELLRRSLNALTGDGTRRDRMVIVCGHFCGFVFTDIGPGLLKDHVLKLRAQVNPPDVPHIDAVNAMSERQLSHITEQVTELTIIAAKLYGGCGTEADYLGPLDTIGDA